MEVDVDYTAVVKTHTVIRVIFRQVRALDASAAKGGVARRSFRRSNEHHGVATIRKGPER